MMLRGKLPCCDRSCAFHIGFYSGGCPFFALTFPVFQGKLAGRIAAFVFIFSKGDIQVVQSPL